MLCCRLKLDGPYDSKVLPAVLPQQPDNRLDAHFSVVRLCCCRLKLDGPYDSKVLPAVLAVTLVSSLIVVFSGAVMRLHSDS
jgi:hypothetical protein